MDKENIIYVYVCMHTPAKKNVCNSAIKKNEIMVFAGKWMELELIMLREISQAQEAEYFIFFSLICRT
jgi:hypothetical protein